MDRPLLRPLDALDEGLRRADPWQRDQPRPQPSLPHPTRFGWFGPRWWPGWPFGPQD